jgi:dolichol kinase
LNWVISSKTRFVARSLVHAALGLCFATALRRFPGAPVVVASAVLAVIFVLVEFASFGLPRLRRWLLHRFALFLRPEEDGAVTGATYYLIGMTAAMALFPGPVAALAILFLAFADPIAAAIGKWRRPAGSLAKNAAGNLTFFAVCLLLAGVVGRSSENGFVAAVVGALAATLAQALPWRVNDNLTIPLAAAAAMSLATVFLGGPV